MTAEKTLTLEELKPLIIEWAKAKDLIKYENHTKQWLKLVEESGELASAILKDDKEKQIDAIGDIFVVLTIMEAQIGIKFWWNLSCDNSNVNLAIRKIINNPSSYSFELSNIAHNLHLDLTDCANHAWNEIKNRTGKTINGTFIKD
jgi:uncharacterized protein YabN with tetrapyrrole methylase and pyrophosphatase domain